MNEEPGLLEVQENNTMITFGRKLKHLRQKNHLTQKELGIAVGFPDSCADVRIAQYEGDVRTPKEDLMKLFASTLGVPVELFTVPSHEYHIFLQLHSMKSYLILFSNLWHFLKVFLLGNKKHRISTVRSVRYILFYDSRKLEFTVLPSFPSSTP